MKREGIEKAEVVGRREAARKAASASPTPVPKDEQGRCIRGRNIHPAFHAQHQVKPPVDLTVVVEERSQPCALYNATACHCPYQTGEVKSTCCSGKQKAGSRIYGEREGEVQEHICSYTQ